MFWVESSSLPDTSPCEGLVMGISTIMSEYVMVF